MPKGINDVYSQDARLTNYSKFYTNEEYIAQDLMPPQLQALPEGKYYTYGREHQKAVDTNRSPGAPASEVQNTLSTSSYVARERALAVVVPDEQVDFSDPAIDPIRDSVDELMELLSLNIEIDLVAEIDATGDFPASHSTTLSGTDQWSDFTNSDPLDDIRTARDQIMKVTGKRPNVACMGWEVFSKLEYHPAIINAIKYTGQSKVSPELLAGIIGVQRVLIGTAVKNTAKEGQTDVLGFVWGKDFWLFYTSPGGLKTLTFGRHFQRPVARAAGARQVVETIDDSKIVANCVRVRMSSTYNDVGTDCGYVIKSAVA